MAMESFALYATPGIVATQDLQKPLLAMQEAGSRNIVIIGGGAVGVSTAYYLTRHPRYNPEVHKITVLEATKIAGGSSGKAGGLVAEWATPKCLAPLSFKKHAELAQAHGGDRLWGHRSVNCAEVELEARNLDDESDSAKANIDWLAPGVLKSYEEIGNMSNSAQVNPFMYTTNIMRLAEEKGAEVVIGNPSRINYSDDGQTVDSVSYVQNGIQQALEATDIVVAAGPWTPQLLPQMKLLTPRGHSVIVRPTESISPYVLFPNITAADGSELDDLISPEVYPRPADMLHDFETVYSAGPDDYDVPLPAGTGDVAVDQKKCEAIRTALDGISRPIRDGEVLVKQACYKPQIRQHEDGEEVGPIVGPMGVQGLWLATGHDEWGMSNCAGTGVILSEMIFDGESKSADAEPLHPKHFVFTSCDGDP